MKKVGAKSSVTRRMQNAIAQLTEIQELLVSNEGLDERILTDFRDALNRVRNAAWSAQQFAALKAMEQDPASLLSLVAGERIRTAFQLVQLIQADLQQEETKFQPGQLVQLQKALLELSRQLEKVIDKAK